MKFTKSEKELVLESLKYSIYNFEEYVGYPTESFRTRRINEAKKLIQKIKKG